MEWTFEIDWDKDGTFTAENTRLLELRVTRGRTRMMNPNGMEPMRTGEIYAVLDNHDGRYDPYNTAGALYSYLKPGRPLRVLAVDGSTTRAVFTGYVSDARPEGGRRSRAVIKAVDGLTLLDRQNCEAVTPATDYAVSQAMEDLLAQSDWPLVSSAQTFPFTWPLTLGSVTLENNGDTVDSWDVDTGKSLLATINELGEAFWGIAYVTASGSLAYRARNTQRMTMLTLDQDILLSDVEGAMPWDEIYNDIRVTATTNTAQTASDTASDAEYWRRTMDIASNDFIQTDAHAGDLANYLELYAPELKRGLRVRLRDRFTEQFGAELTDRVRVTIAALGIDNLYQIGQIEHQWREREACTTTYRLEPDYYEVAGLQTFPFTWPLTLGW